MSIRIIWRSAVFLATIILIYLAFPIFIVPSSLPAIQQMFVNNELPDVYLSDAPSFINEGQGENLEILELSIPKVPTLKDKVNVLKDLHQQGMDKIFQR